MDNFYELIHLEILNGNWKAKVRLNPNHEVYDGHFPGHPIVPGVTLIGLLKGIIESGLKQKLMLTDALSIKFLKAIDPTKISELDFLIDVKSGTWAEVSAIAHCNDIPCLKFKGKFQAQTN